MHSKCRLIIHAHIAGLPESIKKGLGGGTRKAFIASCKTKLLKWEHCLEVRLKMCEEALSNQVKRAKKKKASWETDVNNGPGNERSKLAGRAPVCFYTHPGLAIKQSHFRGGWGGDARKCWKRLRPILRIPCHYPHARERRQVQQCLPGKGTNCTKTSTSEADISGRQPSC